jgi:hypothetical protein
MDMLPFLDVFCRFATTRGKPIQDLIQKDPESGRIIKVKALVLSLSFKDACAVEIHGVDYSSMGSDVESRRGPWVYGIVVGPANQAFISAGAEKLPLTFNRHAQTLAVPISDQELDDLLKQHEPIVQKAHKEAYEGPKTDVA